MRFPSKKKLLAAGILLIYSILVICFVTIPLFNAIPIEIDKKELMIMTLFPLMAFILAWVLLLSKKADHTLNEVMNGTLENTLYIVMGGMVLAIINFYFFTKKLHDFEMCDAIWTPAWIISLAISLSVSTWVFLQAKRDFIFVSNAVIVSVLMVGLTYAFLIMLAQVIAFNAGCAG